MSKFDGDPWVETAHAALLKEWEVAGFRKSDSSAIVKAGETFIAFVSAAGATPEQVRDRRGIAQAITATPALYRLVSTIARMDLMEEMEEDTDGEHEIDRMEDAAETLDRLIHEARALLGATEKE